jgi:hypothetical protein
MKKISGQTVIEYFVVFALILGVILSTGFIARMRGVLGNYFTKGANTITVIH